MNRKSILIPILCVATIIIPNLFGYPPAAALNNVRNITPMEFDRFDNKLYAKIKTVDDLISYLNETYKGEKNTIEFVDHMVNVLSLRFYHGYSYYSYNDNWIVALAGNTIWNDLSAVVIPDDILKYPHAACSQQSMVFMKCAEYYGFDYRKVAFDHHFALEININNKWTFVDVNQEVYVKNNSLQELLDSGRFFDLYKNRMEDSQVKYLLANPRYGTVNQKEAQRASLFHKFTGIASQYLIFVLFIIQLLYYHYKFQPSKLTV